MGNEIATGKEFINRVAGVLGLDIVTGVKVSASSQERMEIEVKLLLTPDQVKKILGE